MTSSLITTELDHMKYREALGRGRLYLDSERWSDVVAEFAVVTDPANSAHAPHLTRGSKQLAEDLNAAVHRTSGACYYFEQMYSDAIVAFQRSLSQNVESPLAAETYLATAFSKQALDIQLCEERRQSLSLDAYVEEIFGAEHYKARIDKLRESFTNPESLMRLLVEVSDAELTAILW